MNDAMDFATQPRSSGLASTACGGWCRRAIVLAWLLAIIASAHGAEADAEATGLPSLVRTSHRVFTIPFRLPTSQDPDKDAAAKRVILNVSKDLGATWAEAGETSPASGSFSYKADVDGEYWFRLRAVDRKGRSRGGEGPDIRVLVDAAGPRLAARVWKGADGEIICRYAAADDSLRLDSLVLEYRGPEDRGWKSVAADAVLARERPAHLVGESIWWAGESVDRLVVRIAVTDEAGNRTDRSYSLEPTDPGVDQGTLAQELGVPPLPSGPEAVAAAAPEPADPGTAVGSVLARNEADGAGEASGWPARTGPWTGGEPQPPTAATVASRRGDRAAATGLLPRVDDPPDRRGSPRTVSTVSDPLAATGLAATGATGPGPQYRGKPLHLVQARRFAWDYEIPAVRRTAGPLRAELWTTRDGGLTWQKAAVDADGRSPIDVELEEPGFYGVRLELVADVPEAERGPRSGTEPDAWVGIDETPPVVELTAIDRDETAAGDMLVIRYAARDPLLPAGATRLLYSPNAEGPWATIAAGAANEGAHRWEPGRSVPARVFVRVEATDAAGNRGFAVSPEPVSVAPTRFGGRLGGLRVVPAP